jgi:hypothetical protein
MTNFVKKKYSRCKECDKQLYVMAGLVLGIPIEFHQTKEGNICNECFDKNPKKYEEKKGITNQ